VVSLRETDHRVGAAALPMRVAIDEALTGSSVDRPPSTTEDALKRESPFIVRVDLVPRGR